VTGRRGDRLSRASRFSANASARIALALLLHACAGCGSFGAQARGPSDPTIRTYYNQVRSEFSGARALETVSFMESTWRLPGNEGFNASIFRVRDVLVEAGYVLEEDAGPEAPLTYRIEHREMDGPTWEPVDGSVHLVGSDNVEFLQFSTNRNMIAINSYSTPVEGVEADLVYVGSGQEEDFQGLDVSGKVVFGEARARQLFREAVQERGAAGILSYSMPAYNRPEVHQNSIQFSSIPVDSVARSWGVRLSYAAKTRLLDAIERGDVRVRIQLQTRIYHADELTLVADVRGRTVPDERFVLSAHVQEPGANDNASGVAVQAELARVVASLVRDHGFVPDRTISMIWGDEISSTYRYIADDSVRASGIRWGVSLDMVGEDTEKTGGTFLIEKMPDPSAVWTRGGDKHTEWGGRRLSTDALFPHYLNDFVIARCRDQAAGSNWVVGTNPYEGGSDHVPFLRSGIPGLLLWHFTDEFYHTDGDRLDKVSPATMTNVGVCTTVSALTLASADGETARFLISEIQAAAAQRLSTEFGLSAAAIAEGDDKTEQIRIVEAWLDWYLDALRATEDIEVGGSSERTQEAIEAAIEIVTQVGEDFIQLLRN